MLAKPIESITADDRAIAEALAVADLPALLPALALATGDLSLLRDDLRMDPTLLLQEQGGLTPDQQADIRTLALDVLTHFRDAGSRPAPHPRSEVLHAVAEYLAGGVPIDEYRDMVDEELAIEGDPRAARWRMAEVAGDRSFLVAVIGAGMSGIVAAYRLAQAGVPYVVLEKNPDVGGTWHDNVYPGCRVDIPNHYYSYSFAQRDDWPYFYSPQAELHRYFRRCVDEFGIRSSIRFSTEVTSAVFDDTDGSWTLELTGPEGESTLRANAVISALGQLNRPKMPPIPGRDSFAGPSFHSARWDHAVELAGRRVGVIGTGCSAAQFVPIIAEEAGALEVFQRTPNWQISIPHYHQEVPAGFRWLLSHVPYYRQLYRFFLFWRSAEGLRPATEVEPSWPDQSRSVSELNDLLRAVLTEAMEAQYTDRPDLRAKVIPSYPPAAKRVVVDNGVWAQALHRDTVTLTVDPIREIVPEGVVTDDGDLHPFDVLIYATGFEASQFLTPLKVVGRGGVDLHERWDGDARAYLGVTVPDFPNFFLLYGPNTNIVINGSIIWFSECEVRYVMDCLRVLLDGGHTTMSVRRDVHDRYNNEVDAANARAVWGVADVHSWYRNSKGRVSQNWPFPLLDFWRRTRSADPADYEMA
jgi:4-hydroxyacetophenone monooxygenase